MNTSNISKNIKKHREKLGVSQDRLSKFADFAREEYNSVNKVGV